MPHRIVNPPELGPPSGFSHAVVAGNMVYLAGQIGTGRTVLDQFDGALSNLLTALRGAGGEPSDLVPLQVFVTDVADYQAVLPRSRTHVAQALRRPLPDDGAVRRHRPVRPGGDGRADGRGRVSQMSDALDLHLSDEHRRLYEQTLALGAEKLRAGRSSRNAGRGSIAG